MITSVEQFRKANIQSMLKLDDTENVKPGMVISVGQCPKEYMVMFVLNDSDIMVIRHEEGVLH